MPRIGLAARFLRPRSSPAASCASCRGAAASSTSSDPFSPPPYRKPISTSSPAALSEEKRSPQLLGIFPYKITTTTTVARDPSSSHHTSRRHLSTAPKRSSSITDAHRDLILGVKEVLPLGHQKPRHRWVHSDDTTNSERDLRDWQEFRANSSSSKIPFVVNPSLQDFEEDKEEAQVVERQEVCNRNSRSSSGDNGRPTTLLYDDEEEVITELDSTEEEESGLSELEDFQERCNPEAEHRDEGLLKAEDSRPEGEEIAIDTSPCWELVGMRGEASAENLGTPEQHSSNWSRMLWPNGQDGSHGGGLLTEGESHGDHHDNGVPYLHTLSVAEIKEILEKARAKDVRILHVRKSCEWVDQLVFASGRSSKHLRGMADAIVYKVKQFSENVGPNSYPIVEGRDGEQWMAIDCGNIVVHIFLEEARSYYNLEEFWTKKSDPRLVETY